MLHNANKQGITIMMIKQQAIPIDVENFGCHISEILMPVFFIDDQRGVCHLHVEENDTVEIVALLNHHVFPTKNTEDAYDLILCINGRQCFADSSMWDMSYQIREEE